MYPMGSVFFLLWRMGGVGFFGLLLFPMCSHSTSLYPRSIALSSTLCNPIQAMQKGQTTIHLFWDGPINNAHHKRKKNRTLGIFITNLSMKEGCLFVCFVCHVEIYQVMASLVALLLFLGKPLMTSNVDFVMFSLMVEKILNIEQFFH